MPIEMPRGLPFSVDTWSPSSKRKRYHFLTHAHKDHCSQINLHSAFPIYTTRLTKTLILQFLPQLHLSLFVEIEVGQSVFIDDPDSPFSVTAFDANHCPGAVMFLFEGDFGNVLHTGDCRLTAECLQNLPLKYIAKKARVTKSNLDYLFLDCTFGSCSLNLPSKHSAIQQVINCIWKHPHAPVVYLACGLLGQEEILVEVSRTFGSNIYVDKSKNEECFQVLALTAPHILSEDASCRFQVLEGFPRLYEKANVILSEARTNLQPEPLFIRPSAQWFACECGTEAERQSNLKLKEAEKDQFGVWHVCYSMHSSREELEWALELLQPKWVISTTPTCRAMELNYVRKHCFTTKITRDDPLWKLLNISSEKSSSSRAPTISPVSDNVADSSALAVPTLKAAEFNHFSPKKLSLNLSPPSCKRPITLFGRARLVLHDSHLSHEQKTKTKGSLSSSEKNAAEELLFEKPRDVMLGRKMIISEVSNVLHEENKMASATTTTTERSLSFREDTDAEGWSEESRGDREDTDTEEVRFEKPKDVMLGRKRIILQDSNVLNEENHMVCAKTGCLTCTRAERSLFSTNAGRWFEKTKGDLETVVEKSASCNGVSNSFDTSIRKLYRSMNVPVPRPLPSLVELMGVGKRTKIGSEQERNLHVVNL